MVGTTSVEISELLGRMLQMRENSAQYFKCKTAYTNVKLMLLPKLVRPGIVTIATNMAGRGTDIKLI